MKTLEEFDFGQAPQIPAARIRELAEGGYVERSEPIVKLIGEAGTGKSRHFWQRDYAWRHAGRNGGCDSRQRRLW